MKQSNEEYQNFEEMLKVYHQNIQILHRHLIGTNWFGDHEQLGDYYDKVQSDLDTVAELGLAIGIEEPTIAESLKHYDELEIKDRNADESYTIVKGYFDDIVAQINRIADVPADVTNKLQEIQESYRLESGFKLYRELIK